MPAGEYVAVFTNAAADPLTNYFSHNFPTFTGDSPNTRNERDPRAPGALGGLDPRETIMWSTTGGRSWVFGAPVGDGDLYGYYAARENKRVPWYGWQEAPGRPARAQQPFNGYGAPARSPVLHLRAGRTKRLTRAGGWGDGSALGVVTVTTAAGRASTTRALGAGMDERPAAPAAARPRGRDVHDLRERLGPARARRRLRRRDLRRAAVVDRRRGQRSRPALRRLVVGRAETFAR